MMEIRLDDLTGAEVKRLLEEHLVDMAAVSPAGSDHTLDLDGLRRPEVTFWTAWQEGRLVGCGALKTFAEGEAEIKSMRVGVAARGLGVGRALLTTLVDEARRRGYRRLWLETGTHAFFEPARRLYTRFGFKECGPFADYVCDPHSFFMSLELGRQPDSL